MDVLLGPLWMVKITSKVAQNDARSLKKIPNLVGVGIDFDKIIFLKVPKVKTPDATLPLESAKQ